MVWAWDPGKDASNQTKHGVSFELAAEVFNDPLHRSEPDPHPDGDRWITIGYAGPVMLFVAHTLLEPELAFGRIISARRVTKQERRRYDEPT